MRPTQRPPFRLLALALCAALATSASAEDLMQVYDQARASDPRLQNAEALRLAAGQRVVQTRALLLPTLSGNATLTDNDSDSSSTRPFANPDGSIGFGTSTFEQDTRQRTYRAQLDQSVFDYSRWTRLRSSRALASQGVANYELANDQLYVRVAEAYFNALTAQTNLEAAVAEETAVGRQLEQADQRFEVGLTAITDVYEARARFDSARANVIITRNLLNDAYEAVAELTGEPVLSLQSLSDTIPLAAPQPPDPESWVGVALEQSPTLAARRFAVAASEHDIRTARAGHFPTLGVQAVYTDSDTWGNALANGFPQPPGSQFQDTAIGLVLNVPIFEGFATQARVREAVYNRDATADLLEIDRRLVVRTTRGQFRSVVAGMSEIEARRAALVSAQSALEATQAGFEVGTRTIVDVLLGQQQLYAAQREYSRTRHEFIVNSLRLKQSAGVIDVKDMQEVNTLLTGPEKIIDPMMPIPADSIDKAPTMDPNPATPENEADPDRDVKG